MNEKDVECKGGDRTEEGGYNFHVVIRGGPHTTEKDRIGYSRLAEIESKEYWKIATKAGARKATTDQCESENKTDPARK